MEYVYFIQRINIDNWVTCQVTLPKEEARASYIIAHNNLVDMEGETLTITANELDRK